MILHIMFYDLIIVYYALDRYALLDLIASLLFAMFNNHHLSIPCTSSNSSCEFFRHKKINIFTTFLNKMYQLTKHNDSKSLIQNVSFVPKMGGRVGEYDSRAY